MAEDMSLLQEIDESLRAEKLEELWKRFGNWVIAGCAGIVAATIASVVWKSHMGEVHARQTSILIGAETLADNGKYAEGAALLKNSDTAEGSLHIIGLLMRAQMLRDAGKPGEAQAVYKEAAGARGDKALTDYAVLQSAVIAANAKGGAFADLSAISTLKSPYRFTAQEVTAAGELQAGHDKKAALLLDSIAKDGDASTSLRGRAMDMIGTVTQESP